MPPLFVIRILMIPVLLMLMSKMILAMLPFVDGGRTSSKAGGHIVQPANNLVNQMAGLQSLLIPMVVAAAIFGCLLFFLPHTAGYRESENVSPPSDEPSQIDVIRKALQKDLSYHKLLALQTELRRMGNGSDVEQVRADVADALDKIRVIQIRKELDPIKDDIDFEAEARKQAREEQLTDEGVMTSDIDRELARMEVHQDE